MVETHSYRLSPFGPALQLGGGSSVISASSFCMRLAEVPNDLDILGVGLVSLRGSSPPAALLPEAPPLALAPLPPRAGVVAAGAVVWLALLALLVAVLEALALELALEVATSAALPAAGVEDMTIYSSKRL